MSEEVVRWKVAAVSPKKVKDAKELDGIGRTLKKKFTGVMERNQRATRMLTTSRPMMSSHGIGIRNPS